MAKLVLSWDQEYDFDLIGISSHLPDYRLVYFINKFLGVDLCRRDFNVFNPMLNKDKFGFSVYGFEEEDDVVELALIGNRSELGLFIPEMKQMDYFLQVWGNSIDFSSKRLAVEINKIPNVLTTMKVDPEDLKSGQNFFY